MESIFFAVDVIGIILVLYWAIINDDRKPGSPTTGLFAYREAFRPPTAGGAGHPPKGGGRGTPGHRPPPPRKR